MMNVLLLLQVLAVFIITGCAQTINSSKLNLDQETLSNENAFNRTSGSKRYHVVFDYTPETGHIEVKDVNVARVNQSEIFDILMENRGLLKKEKRVQDCVLVVYDNSDGTPTYWHCYATGEPKSLSVFDDYRVTKEFGKAVNSKLGDEVQSSCKVTDSNLIGWYRGGCIDGKAHGYGTAVGRDKYFGNFVDGAISGKGEYRWNSDKLNGDVYKGDFSNNELHGKGTFTWSSGDSYVGEFVHGNRTGLGEYGYKDGRTENGFFLNNRLLSESEFTEYRRKTDPVFAKQFELDQYKKAFDSAYSSSDFNSFIAKYGSNDLEGLIPKARENVKVALKRESANAKERALQEYRDSYANANNSYEYNTFIQTYTKNDPEKLIVKAKSAKAAALKSEKEHYDSVSRRNWSPNYKVKVTFKTSPGKAIAQLQKVVAAVKVRDPGGFFNPYWVPTFHASAAYDDKGVVVGEWYTDYYDGLSDWNRYLQREMNKLGLVEWKSSALGETSRPQSNYASSPSSSSPSGASNNSSSSSKQNKSAEKGVKSTNKNGNITTVECYDGDTLKVYHDQGAWYGQCTYPGAYGRYDCQKAIEWTQKMCR